jgi:hypothetical protein
MGVSCFAGWFSGLVSSSSFNESRFTIESTVGVFSTSSSVRKDSDVISGSGNCGARASGSGEDTASVKAVSAVASSGLVSPSSITDCGSSFSTGGSSLATGRSAVSTGGSGI